VDAVELFAGAGGLALGLARASFAPRRIVEWDANCRRTLLANKRARLKATEHWPSEIDEDVRHVDYSEHGDKVDLISGGPPCQPFSLGGRHRAYADQRDMFPEAVRAIREVRPRAFIFENVRGLARPRFSNYLQYIKLQLRFPNLAAKPEEDWADHLRRLEQHATSTVGQTDLEYEVLDEVLNAADYGVPQRRERIFFVGFRGKLERGVVFPQVNPFLRGAFVGQAFGDYFDRHKVASSHRWLNSRSKARAYALAEKPVGAPWRTVRDALEGLPDPELDVEPPRSSTCTAFNLGLAPTRGTPEALLTSRQKR
jgi:DNA (cytosine-5)-methyltransferase 1